MATCENCLHSFVCWKSTQVEKDNISCSDFADRSKYVVREKGEWKVTVLEDSPDIFRTGPPHCGKCGKIAHYRTNFCPNCGADMRKGENR